MEMINQVLEMLTTYKIYWLLAIVGTVVFVIQAFMLFLGGYGFEHCDAPGDGAIDLHADVNGDGIADVGDMGLAHLKVFSFRSIIAFITFFGWGGLILDSSAPVWRFVVAFVLGLFMMILTALVFMLLLKLQNEGQKITPAQIVNASGVVYLTIKGKNDPGKVTVSLMGVTREIEAVADCEIETGSTVKIVEYIAKNRYRVEKK
ncbi:hypothetical protein AAEX28_12820 [Lentisphaerota bacterium WC36G]|nr:hypothetical protein LJT99_15640 [Lentisphaerae bacterium WC36]